MKTLVISRPVYEYIMPLVEYPQDGDVFFIEKTINSVSSIGSVVAATFGKYGEDISYTGMIGNDDVGNKIKEILEGFQIDLKYVETSYTEKTCVSYKVYNSKTNKFTLVNDFGIKTNLTKYKYEFFPDVVIMDDKDYNANLAAINNYPNCKSIFIGDKYTSECKFYCDKCNYVISNLSFASNATGVLDNLNKSKNLVLLFQKFIDLYNSNLIIVMNNFDVLYCVNDEVRMMKNVNQTITNKENVYYALLSYYLAKDIDVENAIKLTNKTMLSAPSEVNMLDNIPDYNVIKNVIEEYKNNTQAQSVSQNTQAATQTQNNNQNTQVANQAQNNNANNQAVNQTQNPVANAQQSNEGATSAKNVGKESTPQTNVNQDIKNTTNTKTQENKAVSNSTNVENKVQQGNNNNNNNGVKNA